MSSAPIRMCSVCGQSYWSMGAPASECEACPSCMGAAMPAGVANPADETQESEPERPRFVTLSALPPEKRLPRRRDGTRPGLTVPRRLAEKCGLPPANLEPPPSPSPPVRDSTSPPALHAAPVSVPLVTLRQLGFNCPSCFTVLVIKDPENYDGRAAPCPCCFVSIMPPRIAPPSPFTLVERPPPVAADAPPPGRPSRWKTFGPHRNDSAVRADAHVA